MCRLIVVVAQCWNFFWVWAQGDRVGLMQVQSLLHCILALICICLVLGRQISSIHNGFSSYTGEQPFSWRLWVFVEPSNCHERGKERRPWSTLLWVMKWRWQQCTAAGNGIFDSSNVLPIFDTLATGSSLLDRFPVKIWQFLHCQVSELLNNSINCHPQSGNVLWLPTIVGYNLAMPTCFRQNFISSQVKIQIRLHRHRQLGYASMFQTDLDLKSSWKIK